MDATGSFRDAVARVRATYTPEKRRDEARADLPAYLVYRPLSFWVTPVFLRLRVSANAVTTACVVLALLMPVWAWAGGARASIFVACAGVVFQVLDCVDGNLARARGRPSRVGHLLDGTASSLFWTAYLVAVGVLAGAEGRGLVGRHGAVIGLTLALLRVVQGSLEDDFDRAFAERVRWEPPASVLPGVARALPASLGLAGLGKVVEHVFAFGALAAAGATQHVGAFLLVVAGWQLTLLGLWVPRWVHALWLRAQREAEER